MWAEGAARVATGDVLGFERRVIAPVQDDLLARTWLNERYLCDGTHDALGCTGVVARDHGGGKHAHSQRRAPRRADPHAAHAHMCEPNTRAAPARGTTHTHAHARRPARSAYFFEYPAVLALLLRDYKYGIRLGLGRVTIAPFGAPPDFVWHVGALLVAHSTRRVLVALPASNAPPAPGGDASASVVSASSSVAAITYSIGGLCAGASYACRLVPVVDAHAGRSAAADALAGVLPAAARPCALAPARRPRGGASPTPAERAGATVVADAAGVARFRAFVGDGAALSLVRLDPSHQPSLSCVSQKEQS